MSVHTVRRTKCPRSIYWSDPRTSRTHSKSWDQRKPRERYNCHSMFFLRKSTLERLPVAMTGVRMGERALQLGIDDPSLAGAIAAKVGLSGYAAIVVREEREAAKARSAAEKAGALVEVQVQPSAALPFENDSFDVIVVHAASRRSGSFEDAAATATMREARRVL